MRGGSWGACGGESTRARRTLALLGPHAQPSQPTTHELPACVVSGVLTHTAVLTPVLYVYAAPCA